MPKQLASLTHIWGAVQVELRLMIWALILSDTKSTRNTLTSKKNDLQSIQHKQVYLCCRMLHS